MASFRNPGIVSDDAEVRQIAADTPIPTVSEPKETVPPRVKVSQDAYIDPEAEATLLKMKQNMNAGYADYSGVGNRKQPEIKPSFLQTTNEKVIDGRTNCFIVLGSDRPGSETSGRGGVGETGAACIDLVAGHLGPRPVTKVNGKRISVSKNFELDAARLYITQKGDIDKYLNIPLRPLKIGTNTLDTDVAEFMSSVTAKADLVRIVGRENIKIVTHHVSRNSLNTHVGHGGVDIIAGCEVIDEKHSLEPMVKGNKLTSALKELVDNVEGLQAIVAILLKSQIAINEFVTKHRHPCGETVSAEMIEDQAVSEINKILKAKQQPNMIVNTLKTGKYKVKYFNPISKDYINSLYNRVN